MPCRSYAMMLTLPLCAAALQPALADAQPRLELEVASGFGKAESSSRSANGASYPWAPILTARAGIDLWDSFTPSIRIFAVAGPAGLDYGATSASGYREDHRQGWARIPRSPRSPPSAVVEDGDRGRDRGVGLDAR